MPFTSEPTGYMKSELSDMEGSWENLKTAVISEYGFPNSDKLIFHINEAMSWESVRNLEHMQKTLLLIENIATPISIPDDVRFWLEETRTELENILLMIARGEKV